MQQPRALEAMPSIHGLMSRSGERIGRLCPEPGRMRYRRLHVYHTDPKQAQGDRWATKRQDSTDAPAMVGSPVGDAN